MSYYFGEDDKSSFLPQFKFGDKIDNNKFKESLNIPFSVNYRYIQLDDTNYHFNQECFDNKDIRAYFKFMKLLSSTPFNSLLDNKKKDWHLNKSPYYQKNLKILIDATLSNGKSLRVECIPTFYHFALYTNKDSSEDTKVKSPRIYFFIGDNATIYPLFYDPYHKINP